MSLNKFTAAALFAIGLASSGAHAAEKLNCSKLLNEARTVDDVWTAAELRDMSSVELDYVYTSGTVENTPTTDTCGVAVFAPGVPVLNTLFSIMASGVWQGKTFNADGTRLMNKVIGLSAFEAEVYKGESWFDGAQSIIIDYSRTSAAVGYIRDEIREVSPNLYLGRAYLRTPSPQGFQVLYFILKTPAKSL